MTTSVSTRVCPYCGGDIEDWVRKCRHCGEWLPSTRNGSTFPLPVRIAAGIVSVFAGAVLKGLFTLGLILAIVGLAVFWVNLQNQMNPPVAVQVAMATGYNPGYSRGILAGLILLAVGLLIVVPFALARRR